MIKSRIIAALALAAFSFSAAAADFTSKHAENKVECTSCHKAGFTAPKADACLACHKQDDIVKATEKFNFTARLTDPKTKKEIAHEAKVNPHDSYHFARTQNCLDCHREHKPSVNACATCHDVKPWKMGAPR